MAVPWGGVAGMGHCPNLKLRGVGGPAWDEWALAARFSGSGTRERG